MDSEQSGYDFVTLGMVIIDEIHFQDDRSPAIDVLGGAGSWAVIGARIFRESPTSKQVAWTVHKGSDFPATVEADISRWNTTCNIIDTPERLTTRGWNKYEEEEKRDFKYTTPKLRIDQNHLTEPMLRAKCFHLICTPTRCINLVQGIMEKRISLVGSNKDVAQRPWFVWEPVPDSCERDALPGVLEALQYVDVVSPNHQELGALFGTKHDLRNVEDQERMHEQCTTLLQDGFKENPGIVIVRCGEFGCRAVSKHVAIHLPPYHKQPTKVIDPTGAGNAFLGAVCMGLLDARKVGEDPMLVGARYGTVAAGCAVEQVGLPALTYRDAEELWNGISKAERMSIYISTSVECSEQQLNQGHSGFN